MRLNAVDYNPFAPHGPLNTTEPQREIIANVLIGGDAANCSYNESVSLHLKGDFDFAAYQKAVALLVSRHPALRSRFSSDGQTQTFDYNDTPEVILADLSNMPEERRQKELQHLLALEADIPFDLFNGPLFRFKVIRHHASYHQLILSFHHLVCDGWSLGIIMQDLGKIYSTLVKGGTYHEEPVVGYEQYVTEEESFVASSEGVAAEKFWLDRFKDNLPSFEVPSDKPRPALRTFNARRIDVEVDPAIVDAVKKAGAKLGASYVTTLTAAFEVFLHRITGSEDVVVGLPAAGQSATGLHALVGHCVNVLPLRTTVDPNLPFAGYLKKRKSELLDAFDHQRFTFGSLVRKLNIPRDPSRIPLIPVAFNLDIGITDGVEFYGCTYEFTTNPRHYENFEIFINASGSGNKLVLECTHNTDLYNTELMQLRMEEFVVMLKGIASSPETANCLLPLLTETEQELIFNKWNSIDHSYDSSLPLHIWFEKTAAAYPGHIAISCEGQNMTYEELNKRSSQLAAWITSNNIAAGSFIGILTHRHPDLIVAMLGILKAGCTYVPVDPNYPADRIHHILSDSKCPLVIVSASLKEMAGSGTRVLCIDNEWEQGPGACLPLQPSVNVSPDSLAYIIYTSGSTGKPKGSLLEHRNVTRLFTATEAWYHFNESDVWTLFHSAAFDFSVWEIWGALLYGGKLVIVPYNTSRDPKSFYELMKKEKVTVLNQTPSAFRTLTDVDDYLTPSERISSLRYIIFGGEALELHALKPWFRNHGDAQPQLVNMYGITETTVHVTYRPLKAADAASGEGSMIGIPIPDLQVYILDSQQHPVGIGVTGEMYVGGAGVGRGYLNRPELTQQRFLPNEYNPFAGTPLYRSGDLARYHLNGDIEYLGRIDNQVKIRGFRIELGEIESVLAKHPDIRQSVVIAREDTPGDKRLVAYLVADQGVNTDTHQLREWIRKDLPDYMVPAAFVMMDKIPVTANGKTDRKALPKPEVNTAVRDDYEEPYTPTEEMLSTIWCNVLGVDRVGRKDNFFELGGHSLLGVKMFNEVERLLGARVHLAALFSAPTVEELARMITHEGSEKPWSCLVPLQPKGSKTPLFCIHMHNGNIHRWRVLKKHLGDDRPLYAIQPRGLDDKQQPHTTIEEMAEYYIAVMKEAQPQGPYNLLGLCFSGMVVYEMAVKLQERGEKVAFLGMVNNYAPPENPTLFKVKTEVNKFLKLDLGEKVKYVKEKQKSLGKRFFGGGGGVEEIQIDEPVKDKTGNDLRTIHSLALLHYHPDKVYNGNLWLFRNNEPIEEFFNEQLGWDRLVTGTIRCDVIDGCNNDTIITDEPYNAILSGHIRHHLDNVG